MNSAPDLFAEVILDVPLGPLDYRVGEDQCVAVGDRVLVKLGSRRLVGIVTALKGETKLEGKRIRTIETVLTGCPPLDAEWLELTRFAAQYYIRAWGEAALPAVPKFFRKAPGVRYESALKKLRELKTKAVPAKSAPTLNNEQLAAVDAISEGSGFSVSVLFGVTGSGKTEVYLHAMSKVLQKAPENQVLLLVPEINLTPQLEARVRERFIGESVVTMHSNLTDTERARNWLAVFEGRSRVLVGTRLAVFTPFRKLALIIVDEEHDASYKAGDGLRQSARDLAVKRAQINGVSCVLGSATPSLETWAHVLDGSYRLLRLRHRAVSEAALPALTLVDTRGKREEVFAPEVRRKIDEALERQEQVLLFINRRGYAPTVSCPACGWVSRCLHCSGFTVFHKAEKSLVCHHCGTDYPVPVRCPVCGNPELESPGFGTERIEEAMQAFWPGARTLRIDRDSVRNKGEAEKAFRKIHEGEVDLIVGTQMIAKGHDFKRVKLVVVLNADAQLLSPNIRAEERLFATMMQVAGRAGRASAGGEVVVQTRFAEHPIFEALASQDYEGFARRLLSDRKESFAPPFVYQALVRAESSALERTLGFLRRAKMRGDELVETDSSVRLYEPVPMSLMRLMDVERGQLLVEADTRRELHVFLARWLSEVSPDPGVSWSVEIDPDEV